VFAVALFHTTLNLSWMLFPVYGSHFDPCLGGLVMDAVFTLDQLAVLNRADPNGILTGKLDLQHVGAFGMSLGGIVVGEACRLEPRLRACLVMAPRCQPTSSGPSKLVTADLTDRYRRANRWTAGAWHRQRLLVGILRPPLEGPSGKAA